MASYKPTSGMKEEAQKGLDWRSEHGRGGTEVGIARARDIINDKNLSESTVKRMYSFFSRHKVDKEAEGFRPGEDGFPSNGRIAWALWGGDPGFTWSKNIVESLGDERSYEESRPYPNEHAARIEDPDKYARFRRVNDFFEEGIHAILGIDEDGNSEMQSIRFDKDKYTPDEAKAWLAEHDFDYIGFEDAIEERQASDSEPLSSEENGDRIANMDTDKRHIKDIRETEDSVIIEFGKSEPEEEIAENSAHMDEEKSEHEEMERNNPVEENSTTDQEDVDVARFYSEESLQRAFEFNKNKIDEKTRTVEIGVSSELPVERSFGYEILGHAEGQIDMDFMASGRAPLLLDHDTTKQIGVVERFSIDHENKRTIAKVRFSKSAKAQEIFEDVKDGIRQSISVGYQVNKMEKEGERDSIPIYRVLSWTPLEVSAVSIPADQSSLVGFGRSKDVQIKSNKPEDNKMDNNVENNKPEVNPADIREQLAKENSAIIELAAKHNKRDLANDAIAKGYTLEQFRGELLETLASKPLDLASNVDMNQKEQREYSLLKAIREAASGNLSGLEREVSDEIAHRTGKSARGFYMPTNINFGKRDQTVGTNSQGGFLKPTDHLSDQFVEALYARLRIGEAGCQVLNGLVGDVAIPKLATSTSNSAFVAEGSAPSEGAAVFSQVTMSPKTLAAYVDVSRKLMMQSDPSVEAVLRNDIINTFARKIDEVAIEGGNSNEPSGIIASSTGNVVSIGTNGGAITYAKAVDMVEAVEVDNAIINDASTKWLGNPKVTANLRTISKQASGVEGNFILGEDNKILGYDYLSSTLVPSDLSKGTGTNLSALIFGDFSQLMLGFYSGVDVVVDQASLSTSGGTRLAFFQDLDVALRHDDAFSVIKDIVT